MLGRDTLSDFVGEDMADRVPAGDLGDIDLDALLRTLWRRRTALLLPPLVLTVLALTVALHLPPRYSASTLLMLDTRRPQVVTAEEVVPGLPTDSAAVHSEVEVLRSRALAEALVEAENLTADPEFNPALADPGPLSRIVPLFRSPAPRPAAEARARVVAEFREALSVNLLNRSLVIEVRVTSRDPEKAARLAAATAGLYLERQLAAKLAATQSATNWLSHKLDDMRAHVGAAEAAVTAYRADHALGHDGDRTATAQQRAELTTQLVEARAARAEAEARHGRLRAAQAAGELDTAPEVLRSPLIQRLREQESQVRRRIADLSARYGPKHPRMIEAHAELGDLTTQIRREVNKIAAAVANEARIARARERALADGLVQLQEQRSVEGTATLHLRELEREAAAARTVYESFLARMQETVGQVGLATPDARIISAAAVPTRPSGPRRLLIVAGAGAAGLLLGITLVFVRERLDRALRHPEDVESRLGRPLLGQVPRCTKGGAEPDGAVAEELRSLRTALALTGPAGGAPRILCVTSSLPGEGKTSLCLWLARSMAAARRIVVVDCDLRRPRLAPMAGVAAGPGLTDVLAGEVPLAEALMPAGTPNLSLLPGRAVGGIAPDVLAGHAMRTLLTGLRTQFDVVLLDTPPVLPVADARLLAPLSDAVLFAVRWETTPDTAARQGLRHLEAAGAPPPGVVLTQIDLRKQASYGYGGYVRYYGTYYAG